MSVEYTYDYDNRYDPAMPVVTMRLGPALAATTIELSAIVDSGADATSIPISQLRLLGARRQRKAWLRGMTGAPQLIDLYAIAVEVGPFRQGLLEVIGDMINDDAIIGRDVLNHIELTLNGPANSVLISG